MRGSSPRMTRHFHRKARSTAPIEVIGHHDRAAYNGQKWTPGRRRDSVAVEATIMLTRKTFLTGGASLGLALALRGTPPLSAQQGVGDLGLDRAGLPDRTPSPRPPLKP